MENLANGETARRSQIDSLSSPIHPANVGEATVGCVFCVAHVCVNQVRARVTFVHESESRDQAWNCVQVPNTRLSHLKSMQGTSFSI